MALSSPVRVVIVDDQPAIRNDAAALLKQQDNFIIVGACGSVQDALILIPATEPDLILLDISLSDGTAFDILEKLSPFHFKVIFLTAHEEYALRAIKVGALDYLLKPIKEQELKQALFKVLAISAEQHTLLQQPLKQFGTPVRIVLRSQNYLQIVELNEIVYCQSDAGYTTFHLTEGRKVLTSRHLKDYIEILPDNIFLRPHQSYLVNKRFIEKYDKTDNALILRDGTAVPVATRRNSEVIDYFNRYQ